jgi:hypothetical protein
MFLRDLLFVDKQVARGKTDFCASHGGGVRCKLKGCNRLAVSSDQLCRTHSQQQSQLSGGIGTSKSSTVSYDDNEDGEDGDNDQEADTIEAPAKKQRLL